MVIRSCLLRRYSDKTHTHSHSSACIHRHIMPTQYMKGSNAFLEIKYGSKLSELGIVYTVVFKTKYIYIFFGGGGGVI